MEGHYAWHAKPMTEEDFRNALAELDVSMEKMPIDASSATQEVVR